MSKLKRKKVVSDETTSVEHSSVKKANGASSSSRSTAQGSSWWQREDLPQVERIWALTLSDFCPTLLTEEDFSVPDLPRASTYLVKKKAHPNRDWRWSRADEEVNPSSAQPPTGNVSKPAAHSSDQSAVTNQASDVSSVNKDCVLQPEARIEETMNRTESETLPDKQKDKHPRKAKAKKNGSLKRTLSTEAAPESKSNNNNNNNNNNAASANRYKQDNLKRWAGWREREESGIESEAGIGSHSKEGSGAGNGSNMAARESHLGTKSSRTEGIPQACSRESTTGEIEDIMLVAEGSGLGLKSGLAAGSGLDTQQGGCEIDRLKKSECDGPETGCFLKTGEYGSRLEAKPEEQASGSGLRAKPEERASGSGLRAKPEERKPDLECCPMCLMPFPAGFTQMDCDGHLAQCLSEIHDDVVW